MDELLLLSGIALIVVLVMNAVNNNSSSETVDDSMENTDTGVIAADQSQPGKLMQLANAIFNFEGGHPGNLNVRNNNPGNLKFAGQPGATQGANGFAVFQTMDQGWSALYRQLQKTVSENPQLDLTQFFARYLGQSDYLNPRVTNQGDPFNYANSVAAKLNVSPSDTLGQIFGG